MVENNENILQNIVPTEQDNETTPMDSGVLQEPIQQAQSDDQPIEQRPTESAESRNWREIRNKNEQLQRERDQAIRLLQYHEQRERGTQKKNETPAEETFNLADDDLVEGKQVKNYLNNELKKVRQELVQTRENSADLELRQRYPDIGDIVSHENIALLNHSYPELAESLAMNPDYRTKAIATYNAIKNMGIAKKRPSSEETYKLEKNVAKPRSVNSINPQTGDTPLSRANSFQAPLSEDFKRKLNEETLLKSRGG